MYGGDYVRWREGEDGNILGRMRKGDKTGGHVREGDGVRPDHNRDGQGVRLSARYEDT